LLFNSFSLITLVILDLSISTIYTCRILDDP
jgi:hypothetical protein